MCIQSERDDTYFCYKLPDETASHVPLYENMFPKYFIFLNLSPLSTHTYSIRKKIRTHDKMLLRFRIGARSTVFVWLNLYKTSQFFFAFVSHLIINWSSQLKLPD